MTTSPPEKDTAFTTEMPAGVMRWPSKPEEHFPMRHSDWKRIRARVKALTNPLPYVGQVGWACVGISASGFLGWMPWAAAYSELPPKAQVHYAWVSPLLILAGIAGLVIAIFCLFVNYRMRKREAVTVESVLREMDLIYEPHNPEGQVSQPLS